MAHQQYRREIIITHIMLIITLLSTAGFIWDGIIAHRWSTPLTQTLEHVLFMSIVAFLIYGGLVYQYCRLAYWRRLSQHQAATSAELASFTARSNVPTLSVLIPSYKEERAVIEHTLLSAALQSYPRRRVVLLVDDPPHPRSKADQQQLESTKQLVAFWQKEFKQRHHRYDTAYQTAPDQSTAATPPLASVRQLHRHYTETLAWLQDLRSTTMINNHAGQFFAEHILDAVIRRYNDTAAALHAATQTNKAISSAQFHAYYRQLLDLYAADLGLFERKRYHNLSHEPNKAMNLNSYIGLMGQYVTTQTIGNRTELHETVPATGDHIPDSDYIITLDADSLLLPDYAARLILAMEQPEFQHVAVIQTPYSALPGAPGMFERIAGATTDVQYIIHQGFTGYNATYWVGANALIRKTALNDIVSHDTERGFPIKRYIQDRTVIEDTESSIDLVAKGWSLYNYPDRLAYSATPPDYGAFLIQRRRWANGGLIILPKLLRYLIRRPWSIHKAKEGAFRVHYLSSIAVVNIGQLVLMLVPLEPGLGSIWLPLTAAPYFLLYHRDLRGLGYRHTDLWRIYALNMLLIPINIGGVLKSVHQGLTGHKIPFGRTPKVHNRTAAPALYHLATLSLFGYSLVAVSMDALHQLWGHAIFSAINAAMFGYVVVRLIGLQASHEDITRYRLIRRLLRRKRPETAVSDNAVVV